MTLEERIAAGEFLPQTQIPPYPARPHLLLQIVGDLSSEELAEIPEAWKEYDRDFAQYAAVWDAYRDEEKKLNRKFMDALFEELGIPDHDPFALKMWEIALYLGGPLGLKASMETFKTLLPLWEVYCDR